MDLKDTLARLRRAFDDGDEPIAEAAQVITEIYAAGLPPEFVPLLDRWMSCVAQAAEELGENAEPRAILDRAHEIEGQLN